MKSKKPLPFRHVDSVKVSKYRADHEEVSADVYSSGGKYAKSYRVVFVNGKLYKITVATGVANKKLDPSKGKGLEILANALFPCAGKRNFYDFRNF